MSSRRLAPAVLGVILLLAGITFSLQGADYIGGSAMSGNSFWLYAGGGVAVLGLILVLVAFITKSRGQKNAGPAGTPTVA